MTIKEHLRRNVALATPVMVGQLGHIMVSVADTAMVGQVGVVPLAAATFGSTFFHILLLFGIGVSYAITPLVAATDEKDQSKLLRILQNGLAVNTMLGLILVLLGFAIVPFLHHFGQEPPVAEAAGPYLMVIVSTIFPALIFQTFRQFSEGQSDTFRPIYFEKLGQNCPKMQ